MATMNPVIVLFCLLGSLVPTCAVRAGDFTLKTALLRTRIDGNSICSLTGRWLNGGLHSLTPIRAWVGIVEDATGGPSASDFQRRHNEWSRQHLTLQSVIDSGVTPSLAEKELEARHRHCRFRLPQYFDCALIEFAEPAIGESRFGWVIDYDVDQELSDEAVFFTEAPELDVCNETETQLDVMRVVMSFDVSRHMPAFRYSERSEKPKTSNGSDRVESAGVVPLQSTDKSAAVDSHDPVSVLHRLDAPAIRKQHLEKIVVAADRVLADVKRISDPEHRNAVLADALYRKGRALGYMELPDVEAVKPVKDSAELQRRFEENFLQLEQVVDVTAPDFILLAIRRQRRRNCRGVALDLVEKYRATHPAPVWHYKKRLDLLTELKDQLNSHQAAAALWLRAKMPKQPVAVLFRTAASADSDGRITIPGSWIENEPYRGSRLTFQAVCRQQQEAVAWLEPQATLHLRNAASESVFEFVTPENGGVLDVVLPLQN